MAARPGKSIWEEVNERLTNKEAECYNLKAEVNVLRALKTPPMELSPPTTIVLVQTPSPPSSTSPKVTEPRSDQVDPPVSVQTPPPPVKKDNVKEKQQLEDDLDQELEKRVAKDNNQKTLKVMTQKIQEAVKPVTIPPPPPPLPPPPPPPPHPRLKIPFTERITYKLGQFVKQHKMLFGALVVLGWLFAFIAMYIMLSTAVLSGYHWACGHTSFSPGTTAQNLDQASVSTLPRDFPWSKTPYPDSRDKRSGMILYPIVTYTSNSAIRIACETPDNFTAATRQLINEGVSQKIRTAMGLISLRDLRYSLQNHMLHNDLDYLCAQWLDIPLCYCVMILEDEEPVFAINTNNNRRRGREWFELVGRVNITSLSTGAIVRSREIDPMCHQQENTPKRFQVVGVRHDTMLGTRYVSMLSDKYAVMAQKIFELQRGYDPCIAMTLGDTIEAVERESMELGANYPILSPAPSNHETCRYFPCKPNQTRANTAA